MYKLITSEGDSWFYDTYDEADRTRYIFGGTILKVEARVCPICGGAYTEPPALSRKDNKTEICSDCGMKEALDEFYGESRR